MIRLLVLATALVLPTLRADSPLSPSQAELERLVAAEPANAAAHHALGLLLKLRPDLPSWERAVASLQKASELAPTNAAYLADFGGTSMQLGGRVQNESLTRAMGYANRGRDACEKALTLNPADLDNREGLFQFYQQAPWPVGSTAKAAAHLAEIAKRDPDRAAILGIVAKTAAKKYDEAFKLCEDALAKNPANYLALYHYGRTAAISGQHLPRGLACLRQALTLPPPSPASPKPTNLWNRLGNLEEKLGHAPEAQAAYETALQLDPTNKAAATALAKLKK